MGFHAVAAEPFSFLQRSRACGDITPPPTPSYSSLLSLWWSMKLTEMYGNTVQENEQFHQTYFIITNNDESLTKRCVHFIHMSDTNSSNESIG